MADDLVSIGFAIILIGIVLLFVGILSSAKGKAKVESGGIIFIGPFPIIGGATSERAFYILMIASVVFFVLFILLNRLR